MNFIKLLHGVDNYYSVRDGIVSSFMQALLEDGTIQDEGQQKKVAQAAADSFLHGIIHKCRERTYSILGKSYTLNPGDTIAEPKRFIHRFKDSENVFIFTESSKVPRFLILDGKSMPVMSNHITKKGVEILAIVAQQIFEDR